MSDITANRLSDEDRSAMRTRVLETLHRWDIGAVQHHGPGRRHEVSSADRGTLERSAWHAIGCDSRDLRDSELVEIRVMVDGIVDARTGDWAKRTFSPECPACGGYLLPCTATATGIHPGLSHR